MRIKKIFKFYKNLHSLIKEADFSRPVYITESQFIKKIKDLIGASSPKYWDFYPIKVKGIPSLLIQNGIEFDPFFKYNPVNPKVFLFVFTSRKTLLIYSDFSRNFILTGPQIQNYDIEGLFYEGLCPVCGARFCSASLFEEAITPEIHHTHYSGCCPLQPPCPGREHTNRLKGHKTHILKPAPKGWVLYVCGSRKAEEFERHFPGVIRWISQCTYAAWVKVKPGNEYPADLNEEYVFKEVI